MAKVDEPQCIVIEYVVPAATALHLGPGSREQCEAYKRSRDRKPLPRDVTQRDVMVVELAPLPS